jgi:hypothetical protein
LDPKSFVGQSAGPYEHHVTQASIDEFARVVGAPSRGEAPPTYMTIFRQGEFELMQKLGIPLSKVLHGEQEYSYESPIRSGDELAFRSTVASANEKAGMLFLIFETTTEAKGGRKIGTSKTTVIVRGFGS